MYALKMNMFTFESECSAPIYQGSSAATARVSRAAASRGVFAAPASRVAQRPSRGESACLWAGAGGSNGALAVHTMLCTSLESLGWLCDAQGGAVGSLTPPS